MFRPILTGVIAAGLLATAPLTISTATAAEYTLRYTDLGPPRGPRAKSMMWWADELKKRSGGRIEIQFFWSQSLVKGKATMKAVGSGISEMGTVLGVYTPAQLPIWNYANTPFTVADMWVGMRTWHELRQTRPELRKEVNKHNVKILGQYSTGPVNILSAKTKITTLAELKGKKIRATGGIAKMFKALGGVPVGIGFSEIYSALDRGTIDATITYTPLAKAYKQYEVASHLTETRLGQILGYGPGINLKLFKRMPKDIQDILVNTSNEMIDVYAKNYIGSVDGAKAAMTKGIDGKKVTIYPFSAEEREKWKKPVSIAIADWKKKMKKKGLDAEGFLAAFEKTKAKYEAELKAKGYPWQR